MSIAETVDGLADGPVLVFGSPPPEGRDLDLLVRPAEQRKLAEGLEAEGFARAGHVFAAFRDCSVDVVELVPAADWGIPEGELDSLFAAARPLDGATRLLRPAAPHALLILARKAAWGVLGAKGRSRLGSILAEQPDAFEDARRLARAWGADAALESLEHAWRTGRPPSTASRARAVEALLRSRGMPRGRARLAALRAVARRPRRGALITLSGLDGAGKSSQARALRATLERLGYDAVIEWSSLSQHPALLHAITRAGRWLLASWDGGEDRNGGKPDPGKALRERSHLVTFGWSTLVAIMGAVGQSRAAHRHLWRGRVVICDRYTLDSKVHLRYAYGEEGSFRLQTALIRLLSPRPDRAYFLDVSAETATVRKQDFPLAENARRARLYREEAGRLGVRRLDGERPREAICAELAAEVWELLR